MPEQPSMSGDHANEEWSRLYKMAMLELEHAKLAGRIGEARLEIAARIERLRHIPGLHEREKQAIEDALNGLQALELEDKQAQANECRIAEIAMEKLRILAPKLGNK
jgi:hypothetical protein